MRGGRGHGGARPRARNGHGRDEAREPAEGLRARVHDAAAERPVGPDERAHRGARVGEREAGEAPWVGGVEDLVGRVGGAVLADDEALRVGCEAEEEGAALELDGVCDGGLGGVRVEREGGGPRGAPGAVFEVGVLEH